MTENPDLARAIIGLRVLIGSTIIPFIISSMILISKKAESLERPARILSMYGLAYLAFSVILLLLIA